MKIFITTGTQEPFDRLVKAVDEIVGSIGDENLDISAQVCKTNYRPINFKTFDFVDPKTYEQIFDRSDLIVAHAGIGTILSALLNNKMLIVMPRRLDLKEHRNDHQLFTVRKFDQLGYLHVAYDKKTLENLFIRALNGELAQLTHNMGKYASNQLIKAVDKFINEA